MHSKVTKLAEKLRQEAIPLDSGRAFDSVLQVAGRARLVLIGEASHGTDEFYRTRAELTKRLISEHGFTAVVCEADWPDAFRVHRYVTGRSEDCTAEAALADFGRFPIWMWRNVVVGEFVEWLRVWNADRPQERRAGFFGMDLYNMHASIDAVLRYLEGVDPAAARRARERYRCFEHFAEKPEAYGSATARKHAEPCEQQVIEQLRELQRKQHELQRRGGLSAAEEFFSAEQNARLILNAEQYYRSMFRGRDESWNLRDTHMFDTLEGLLDRPLTENPKLVVWAHNSHLGNAAATEMQDRGELNVGQLVRDRHGSDAVSIGFSGYDGTVTAARDWGGEAEVRKVRPGLSGSYEELFHEIGVPAFVLDLQSASKAVQELRTRRLLRAIGVIYQPATERWSHYLMSCLPDQFDFIIHLDTTRALEPMDSTSDWDAADGPETSPLAL